MVIWGWVDRLHYLSRRGCGYAMVHTHHLFLHESRLLPVREARFLQGLETNKPAIFIKDTEGLDSTWPYRFTKMYDYTILREYINRNYTVLETIDGIAIYRRNLSD